MKENIKWIYIYMLTEKYHGLFNSVKSKDGLEFAVKYFRGQLYKDLELLVEYRFSFFRDNFYTPDTSSFLDRIYRKVSRDEWA